MKKDFTTIIGALFLGGSILMFLLWMYMAAQHKPVVGLEHYYVWGSALFGTALIVMPQDKIVSFFVGIGDAITKKINK